MSEIISIGLALDTSQVLAGTKAVDTALRQVQAASASTAQSTKQVDQASRAAGQAMQTESSAALATAQALRQTATAATAASQQIGGIGSAMRSFASQTGAFALAQVGVLGFQAALSTAKDALVDLVKTGIQMQNLRASFAAVSGGAQAGAKDFQFVVKTANQLGLEIKSVAEQYRSLSAATRGTTLQGADTRELFVTLSKAAQAYGLSTEQLGRAMTAFQQIISKGKVSMEELRGQLGEAIPGAMQIAARAYGTNTQALEGMIEKGVAAEGFVRRFMGQLASEVPPAADRAGKGIQNFGNEILLLKDRIAQSGLLRWIDTVIGKLAELLRLGREGQDKLDRAAGREVTREVGGAESMDAIAAKDAQALLDKTKELRAARRQLADDEARLATAREQAAGRGRFTQGTSAEAQRVERARQEVERLKQERTSLIAQSRLAAEERQQGLTGRRGAYGTGEQAQQSAAVVTAEKDHKAAIDASKTSLDTLNKSAAVASEIYGKQSGTLKEQNVYLSERIKLQEKALETATKAMLERPTGQPLPAEQLKQHEALRKSLTDDRAQLEKNKTAIEDLAKAETKRLADLKKADDDAKALKAKNLELDKQQADEVARTHFQSIEQLRRMAAQYTEVKTTRDADTASVLAQSLATSQYRTEAEDALKVIQDTTRALEDRAKIEAQLPSLREEAQESASTLAELNRLQRQLEPSRRSMTTAERLAATRAEIAAKSGNDSARLTRADEQIKETLNTEIWDKWKEAGLSALDHVGDALADLALKGKLSFKDMLGAIADDLFRFSMQQLMQSATQKGGWLELGFQALGVLTSAAGAAGGAGGAAGGIEVAGVAATSAIPRRQHGGPVSAGMPYWVGEKGPELVVPRSSGTVVPAGQAQAPMQVVNHFHITTPDANSFTQSRGAISRAVMSSLTQARQQM